MHSAQPPRESSKYAQTFLIESKLLPIKLIAFVPGFPGPISTLRFDTYSLNPLLRAREAPAPPKLKKSTGDAALENAAVDCASFMTVQSGPSPVIYMADPTNTIGAFTV